MMHDRLAALRRFRRDKRREASREIPGSSCLLQRRYVSSFLVPLPRHITPFPYSQGTGAVTLAAVMAAIGVTKSKLKDQRIIVYGAGSAGLGITRQLRDGMVTADEISPEEANKKFYLIDKFGLIKKGLGKDKIRDDLEDFVRPDEEWANVSANDKGEISLLEVVKSIKPTVLIGCSTHAGGFTKEVCEAMAKGVDRPIILPLSNPSRLVEVDPKDANDWTGGKALLATGSPFPPAKMPGGKDYM